MNLRAPAFTIIELLVVTTIIVVLISLLTPALDRAIYQAELVLDAANMRTIATGATAYTGDYQRRYPYRVTAVDRWVDSSANQLVIGDDNPNGGPRDDRPVYVGYIQLENFLDPFAGQIDISKEANAIGTWVYSNYNHYFGYGYTGSDDYKYMNKLGDKLVYKGIGYDALVTEFATSYTAGTRASHPDRDPNKTYFRPLENEKWLLNPSVTYSLWEMLDTNDAERGDLDIHSAHQDLSVRQHRNVAWDAGFNDSRFDRINEYGNPDKDDRMVLMPAN